MYGYTKVKPTYLRVLPINKTLMVKSNTKVIIDKRFILKDSYYKA